MNKKAALEDIYKYLEKRRLKNSDILAQIPDKELKLLKGHLLIEEVMYDLLKNKMIRPKSLDKARLTFSQLIILVEGLYYEKELENPWLYRATEKLNKIRNKLAHNAEPKNISDEIEVFSDYVVNNLATDGFEPKDKLLYALGSIHLNFASILTIDKKLSLLPKPLNALSFSSKLIASKLISQGAFNENDA